MAANKPRNLPIGPELGQRRGSGQDNVVYQLVEPADRPHLRVPTGWVVKVNHEHTDPAKALRGRADDPRTAAERGIKYKKNKYDLLKFFLGDFIPQSGFVLAQEGRDSNKRFAEVTFQQEVPRYSLSNLTDEQKSDPRLAANLSMLLTRMQTMYSVLGEVNARTSQGVSLDAKLDLGGVSDAVRAEDMDHHFSPEEIQAIIHTNTSPNLLVDPETMGLYCIDFDQGQWTDDMDSAKELAYRIAEQKHNMVPPTVGRIALNS